MTNRNLKIALGGVAALLVLALLSPAVLGQPANTATYELRVVVEGMT